MLADAGEVLGEREGGLVPAVPVLLERGLHHDLELDGHARIDAARVGRALREDRLVERLARRRLERPPQRHGLVERRAERVDVGAPVRADALAGELLGAHVGRRSEHVARSRERLVIGGFVAREAEVEHHRLVLGRDDDVRGLDVAMDDAELVGGVKRARDLLDDQHVLEDLVAREPGARDRRRRAGRFAGSERGARLEVHRAGGRDAARRLAGDPAREAFAFDVAHRDERDPVLDSRVVDGADSRDGRDATRPLPRGGSARASPPPRKPSR